MRELLLRGLLVFFLATVADTAGADDKDAACGQIGSLASSIMKARQAGADLSALMEASSDVAKSTNNEKILPAVRQLIILAYQKPQFSTEEVKTQAVQEFSNQAQLLCYQSPQ